MKFNILHGKDSSLELTPFQEGNCYITHDGYFYVDLNIGTAAQPNYKRIKLNANQAESLLNYDVIPKEVHIGNDEAMPENATIQILLDGNDEQIALENKLTDYIDASMTLQLEEAKNEGIFDGEDGKSAYEIWLQQDNIGSEEDFLESLKGASGVYVGSGDMPEECNVQIDPDGSAMDLTGATFIPSISSDGILSWTNDKGLENPSPIKVKGDDGYTPQKRVDYFTEADKAEFISEVLENFVDVSEVAL